MVHAYCSTFLEVLKLSWRKRPVEARENEVRFLGVPPLFRSGVDRKTHRPEAERSRRLSDKEEQVGSTPTWSTAERHSTRCYIHTHMDSSRRRAPVAELSLDLDRVRLPPGLRVLACGEHVGRFATQTAARGGTKRCEEMGYFWKRTGANAPEVAGSSPAPGKTTVGTGWRR